ncbi:MAG: DUF1311 domain-containing protein [Candidatus Omnitrophica bacterium]|nr:DUF1311 domain-containing protein [Candidatus Omnitrophota bacterium]
MKKIYFLILLLIFTVTGCNHNYERGSDHTSEDVYNFSKEAKSGNSEALKDALNHFLFRANSLRRANPKRALDLYYMAKKTNPDLSIYDEENKLRIMKKCAEAKGFDVEKFMEKYKVKDEDEAYPFYDVWELAEEASRGGRFGEPDPELVFNLVIRGSWVPAELESAVDETYKNWKNDEIKEFNICEHVTSGVGMGYCMARRDTKDKKKRQAKLKDLQEKLHKTRAPLLTKAYNSMVKFIENKASSEEGHDGTGRTAWIIDSEMEQKNEYLRLINDIYNGFIPSPANNFEETDRLLNEIYQGVIEKIKARSAKEYYLPSIEELYKVQRLWISYRDNSVKLFIAINPLVEKGIWKSWLAEVRIKQLKDIVR